MKPSYQPSTAAPKPGSACVFGVSRTNVRLIDLIREAARALWPSKTAVELALRTGVSTRTCEYWLAGRCGLSADALAALLRSEHGMNFLAALMVDADPAWWRGVQQANRLGAIRRQKRQLEDAIREAELIGGSIARAEAALCIQDENFHRPQLDAFRAAAGVSDRPVAGRRQR